MRDLLQQALNYQRFFLTSYIVAGGSLCLILGGNWLVLYLLIVVVGLISGDLLLGEDLQPWTLLRPRWFGSMEWAAQLLSFGTILLFLWMLAAPEQDLFGFAHWLERVTGIEMWRRHQRDGMMQDLAALALAGFAGGVCAVQVGHELMHQTASPVARALALCAQALCLISRISVQHPFGHHAYAGTLEDPATPQRGENFYLFVPRSIIGQYRQAWDLERTRLNSKGISALSVQNQLVRGWCLEALVVAVFTFSAGFPGLVGCILLGLLINLTLEFANYIQHYGLIRVASEPFAARHAWNDNHRMSLWFGGGIPRHADHHVDASLRFWQLKPLAQQAPRLAAGYLGSILMVLVPRWWHATYNAKLLAWDVEMASPQERQLAQRANALSAQGALMQAALGAASSSDFDSGSNG